MKLKFAFITEVSLIRLLSKVPFWVSLLVFFKEKLLDTVFTYFKVIGVEQSAKNIGVLYFIILSSFLSFKTVNSNEFSKGKSEWIYSVPNFKASS